MINRIPSWADLVSMIMGVLLLVSAIHQMISTGHTANNIFICGIIALIPTVLKSARVLELPWGVTLLIALSVSLHGFGLRFDFYSTVGFYDTITHTLSSAVVGVIVFYAMMCFQHYGGGKVNFTGRGLALFTALISMTFSVYWEVMEYLSDVLIDSMTQYSPYDTLTDLVCDSLGTLLASVGVGFYMRGRTIPEAIDSLRLDDRIKSFASKKADGGQED